MTSPRRLLCASLAGALLLGTPAPASAGWTTEPITESFFLSRPSLAVASDDTLRIAYQRVGSDGGIRFASNASGGWAYEQVTDGSHWAPDLALAADDTAHVAYLAFGTDAGLHYLTNAGGTWADTRLVAGDTLDVPTIVVDGAGKIHIAYSQLGARPGIYHLTNETGAWVTTRVAAGTHDWSPDLAVDGAGTLHLAFASFTPESKGLYYQRRTGAAWTSATRITSSNDDWPALAVDAAGKAHVAFQRFGPLADEMYRGQLFYGTNVSGSWKFDRVPGALGTFEIGPPAIAISHAGTVTIADYEEEPGASKALHVVSGTIGAWGATNAMYGDFNFPSIAYDGSDQMHFGYRSYAGDWAGIEHRLDLGWGGADLIERTVTDMSATLDIAADGTRHLAFERAYGGYLDRGIQIGDDDGGWQFDRIETRMSEWMAGPPDLVLAADETVRIIRRETYVQLASNGTGSWVGSDGLLCTEGSLAVDGAGAAHVACRGRDWATLDYFSDASGTVNGGTIAYPVYGGDAYRDPSITVDGAGTRTIIVALQSASLTPGLFATSAPAGSGWSAPTRLWKGTYDQIDSTLDAAGAVHAVFVAYGADRGVWYATNASGSWVKTRLSRSGADYAPSIEVDATGKVYTAFMRDAEAAYPGLYLVSNRGGTWATYRLTGTPAGEPSLAVGADGKLDIAFADGVAGIRILAEDDGLAASMLRSPAARGAVAAVLAQAEGDLGSGGVRGEPLVLDGSVASGGAPRGAGTERSEAVTRR